MVNAKSFLYRVVIVAMVAFGANVGAGFPAMAREVNAAEPATPLTVVQTVGTKEFTVQAVFIFPTVAPGTAEAKVVQYELAAVSRPPTHLIRPQQDVWCNAGYSWFTSEGTFSYQHACGGSTGPWGFTIQPTVQLMITSLVSEQGMDWTENYFTMPRQAPHVVPRDYWFHGAFNPCYDWDIITYYDYFTFLVNVGGHTGSGSITINGELHNIR